MSIRRLSLTRSTRTRFLLSYLFFLLPLIVFGILWTLRLMNDERQLAETSATGMAARTSSRLTSLIGSVDATLSTMAEVPSVQDVKADAAPLLTSVLDLNPSFNNFYLINRDGVPVAVAAWSPQLGSSFSDRYYFQQVLRTGQPAVGEVVLANAGKAKGTPVVHFARPLKDSSGNLVGVLAASISLENLGKILAEEEDGGGPYVYVADGTGRVLLHPNQGFVRSLRSFAEVPPVAAALRGEQGVMDFSDPTDRQDYLAVYRPVPSAPWGVVAVYPLKPLEAAKFDAIAIGTLAIVLSSGLAFLLATLLTKPVVSSLGELTQAAGAIRQGKLGTIAQVKRQDEIGTLAQVFNAMSLDLLDMVKRLEEAHRQLERAYQEVGEALTSGLDLHHTLEVALRSAALRLGMESAVAGLLEDGNTRLRWVAATGETSSLPLDSTIAVEAADPLVRRALTSLTPATLEESDAALIEGMPPGAALALPLVSRGQPLGVFILYGSPGRPTLSAEEIASAQTFANQVAVAVANAIAHAEIERLVGELQASNEQIQAQNEELQAQNEEIQAQNEELQSQSEELKSQTEEIGTINSELQARNDELEELQIRTQAHAERLWALREVSVAVSSSLELEEICQQAIQSTVRVMGAKVGVLHIANEEAGTLELKAHVGATPEYVENFSVLPLSDQCVSGAVALSGKPQVLSPGNYPPITHQAMAALGTKVVVTIPIACKGKVTGTINVNDPFGRQPTADEVELLMTIANQIGVAIENGVLYGQVKEVDELKDEFLSIASHELKTPLTSIKGYAQLLQRKGRETNLDEAHVRGLQVINEQVDRMTRLVNEFLDVSRIEGGRLELHSRPLELCRLTKRVVENVQVTTEKHRLHLELPQIDIIGSWDEGRVEQVLQNLLSNAVKYSPRGGQVWVKVGLGQGEVEVSVRDEGIGIPPRSLPHLFDRFFQASNVTGGNYAGLGLGLYVSREIITRHNGRMWAESEEGKGSTFFFTLPL